MRLSTRFDSIFKLFLHNMRTQGLDNVTILKGSSDDIIPLLPKEYFDFIYIDGDHAYSAIKKDIVNCLPLLKKGGIICGDDLERQLTDVDVPLARSFGELDYQKGFHPGVSLAVYETLGTVNSEEGFWHALPMNPR